MDAGCDQAPANRPLSGFVLMMVLWREGVRTGRCDFFCADLAAVNPGERRWVTGFMRAIKSRIGIAMKVSFVLEIRHKELRCARVSNVKYSLIWRYPFGMSNVEEESARM